VYWENEELDWDAYEICVEWCKKEGIRTIADLKNRVVPQKDYETLWHRRCEEMQQSLEKEKLQINDNSCIQMKSEDANKEKKHIDQLVKAVLKSSKYRNVCEDLIRNIGLREISKRDNLKIAIKSTKNKLHQIGGAYFLKKPNYGFWLEKLRKAKKSGNDDLFRKSCAEIMSYHYSTRERLNILDEFYARIFSLVPPVQSIMDVASGFHPLAIPWMPITRKVTYYAYDVYKDMIGFLNGFMAINDVQGYAEVRDVTQHAPEINADLAFILNTIPCFEQIEKSAGLKILEAVNANFLAVSFPAKTLGGKEKNMLKHYEAMFNKLTREKDWIIQRLEFRSELVFLIKK
jgi:16S rRNA (guanine(1405)-N(7))-methyltransferase